MKVFRNVINEVCLDHEEDLPLERFLDLRWPQPTIQLVSSSLFRLTAVIDDDNLVGVSRIIAGLPIARTSTLVKQQ